MMAKVYKEIKIKQNNGQITLSLVDSSGQTIMGQISFEQLMMLNGDIERILDPQKNFKERLRDLKRFKREAFNHYRQEQDPKLKEQRLNFYIEAKRLVAELEEGLSNGS